MELVKFENVKKSYNGRPGCMCGCNGTYTLPSHVSVKEANKATGWDAYNSDDVSDRRVKLALNKVNKALELWGELDKNEREARGLYVYDFGAFYETDNRVNAVYFEN